ncbi:hypothetical protein Syun_009172 [Stephania yunnanensis]|uniref:Uncharacterized protein n=1 Tax=Stephania yunnanensis TaxID=152371 RepID=A0AAP0PN92_9MAGN
MIDDDAADAHYCSTEQRDRAERWILSREMEEMETEQRRKKEIRDARDIFGARVSEGASHESHGHEDNSVPLVDEVFLPNVIYEQDFNTCSHPIPAVGMPLGSIDELLETYQDHAKEKVLPL